MEVIKPIKDLVKYGEQCSSFEIEPIANDTYRSIVHSLCIEVYTELDNKCYAVLVTDNPNGFISKSILQTTEFLNNEEWINYWTEKDKLERDRETINYHIKHYSKITTVRGAARVGLRDAVIALVKNDWDEAKAINYCRTK